MRSPDPDALEGGALRLLSDAGCLGLWQPSPIAIAQGLGYRISRSLPPRRHGWVDHDNRIICVRVGLTWQQLVKTVGHENGHILLERLGVPREEQEPYADAAAKLLELPRASVLQSLTDCGGFVPSSLIADFPHSAPIDVLTRAAHVAGVGLLICSARSVLVMVNGSHWREVNITMPARLQRRMVGSLLGRRRCIQTAFGVTGWRFDDGAGRPRVALVVDPDRCLAVEVGAYQRAAESPLLALGA